jgi:hydroxylamine reductase
MQNTHLPMFCDQCEQTAHSYACTDIGVCGKSPVVESLQKLLIYGVKGVAAYKAHARRLGKTDAEVEAFIEEALFATMTNVNFDVDSLIDMCMECGRMNLRTMQLLNDGHVERFGAPSPTKVREGIQPGPGILVTGHDLEDLSQLLEHSAGKGVSIYTHGEMLPGHMYAKLRAHEHLVGHFGGAWQKQRREFERFGGPILATTNCVLIPHATNTYLERLWTIRQTGIPGARRVRDGDFGPVIEQALAIGDLEPSEIRTTVTGHHWSSILAQAGAVVDAVKAGKIRRLFVIGGCDGAEIGRNYYSDFAYNAPQDSVILTLGCGKYRIRDHDYGEVAGIPRLLDLGQCNDAYGALQVALALADAFECGVNDLPLTLLISWFEQKAVAVLLTLLHLGVKGIRLGPKLPAFIAPEVLDVLVERFELQPIGREGRADVAAVMAS